MSKKIGNFLTYFDCWTFAHHFLDFEIEHHENIKNAEIWICEIEPTNKKGSKHPLWFIKNKTRLKFLWFDNLMNKFDNFAIWPLGTKFAKKIRLVKRIEKQRRK